MKLGQDILRLLTEIGAGPEVPENLRNRASELARALEQTLKRY
ncbi:hypothetical protein GZL_00981 [Streptomyces sp. 769]|nr:hypothetical protein GZL_00981 [Streptomyces sp. 769]